MQMKIPSTSQEFFDQKYREDRDPWNFACNAYEQGRYEIIMKAISHRRYQRAFEPGCSLGILTRRLGTICDQVIAMDISETAVTLAREHCDGLSNVDIMRGSFPTDLPAGTFDLLLLSEIGYYFTEQQLRNAATALVAKTRRSGTVVATHWLGTSDDHLLSGDRVHEVLRSLDGLSLEHEERHPGFRLDRWLRV